MANKNRRIYPETWVLGSSIVIGALIIALNLRGCSGCKDCNENAEYAPKTKADTVWVNKNAVTINGDNNIVNVNQGTDNKIDNRSGSTKQNAVKPAAKPKPQSKPHPKAEAPKSAVVHDTVYVEQKPKAQSRIIVDYTQTVVCCDGTVTTTDKKAYFTKIAEGDMRLDSVVDIKRIVDTCNCR